MRSGSHFVVNYLISPTVFYILLPGGGEQLPTRTVGCRQIEACVLVGVEVVETGKDEQSEDNAGVDAGDHDLAAPEFEHKDLGFERGHGCEWPLSYLVHTVGAAVDGRARQEHSQWDEQ